MISPVIVWDHSNKWMVPKASDFTGVPSGGTHKDVFEFDVTPGGCDDFLLDHIIDGTCLFPTSGHILIAWKALAKYQNKKHDELAIVIEDLHIDRPKIVPKTGRCLFIIFSFNYREVSVYKQKNRLFFHLNFEAEIYSIYIKS